MNLILQVIKSLFRKVENTISQNTSVLLDRLGRLETDIKNTQNTANTAVKIASKSSYIYLNPHLSVNFVNAPLDVGKSRTTTLTESYKCKFRYDNNDYVDIIDLDNIFSSQNEYIVKIYLTTVSGTNCSSEYFYATNGMASNKGYAYQVHGVFCDDIGVYKVSIICTAEDYATLTITRVL